MKHIFRILSKIELLFSSIAITAMVFLTAGSVIARKVFNSSWSFTEELTCALFVAITMIGAAMLSQANGHITLDIMPSLLPRSFQKPLIVIAIVVPCLFSVILTGYGLQMIIDEYTAGMTSPALKVPEWIYGSAIPIGGLLIFLHTLEWGIQTLCKKEKEE